MRKSKPKRGSNQSSCCHKERESSTLVARFVPWIVPLPLIFAICVISVICGLTLRFFACRQED
jgi:hypothetical protein